jgi:hypothetical protein
VALSEDGGRSWRFIAFPRGYEDAYAEPGRGGTLRLSADRVNHGYEHYVSFDRGRTWKRVRGSLADVAPIAPEGEETWAVKERADGVLWRSPDGGRHWTEVRPRPPTTR